LGPVVPSFRALSGRLKFADRRHHFNKDSLSLNRRRQSSNCWGSHIVFLDCMFGFGDRVLDFVCWILGVARWVLGFGFWILEVGCWGFGGRQYKSGT